MKMFFSTFLYVNLKEPFFIFKDFKETSSQKFDTLTILILRDITKIGKN